MSEAGWIALAMALVALAALTVAALALLTLLGVLAVVGLLLAARLTVAWIAARRHAAALAAELPPPAPADVAALHARLTDLQDRLDDLLNQPTHTDHARTVRRDAEGGIR